jgi:peptidoglycan-associated lipoprotein
MNFSHMGRSLRLISVLCVALAVTACAKNPNDESLANGLGANGGLNGRSAAPGSIQDFSVNVGDRVFFESDQTEIDAAGQATLEKQARWLSQYGNYAFTVEGHADERGTREYNFALGARRAESVKAYLISKGVSAGRIKTVSYGKERPVATCNDITCWSQNRRAVTVLNGSN